jgi:hypothetical protein
MYIYPFLKKLYIFFTVYSARGAIFVKLFDTEFRFIRRNKYSFNFIATIWNKIPIIFLCCKII